MDTLPDLKRLACVLAMASCCGAQAACPATASLQGFMNIEGRDPASARCLLRLERQQPGDVAAARILLGQAAAQGDRKAEKKLKSLAQATAAR